MAAQARCPMTGREIQSLHPNHKNSYPELAKSSPEALLRDGGFGDALSFYVSIGATQFLSLFVERGKKTRQQPGLESTPQSLNYLANFQRVEKKRGKKNDP